MKYCITPQPHRYLEADVGGIISDNRLESN